MSTSTTTTTTTNSSLTQSLTNQLTALTAQRNALKSQLSTPITSAQIAQLKDIYDKQLALYKLIHDLNTTYNNTLQASQQLTNYQTEMISKMTSLEADKQSKINEVVYSKQDMIRKSKINRYYGDKYEAMITLIKIITMMLIPTIALAYLNKQEYIKNDAFHVFAIIIVVIGGIFFLKQLIDIMRKSNMDFDEYDIPFSAPPSESLTDSSLSSSAV
jgi:cation transport ATPase